MSTYSRTEGTRNRDVTAPATIWRTGMEVSGIEMPDAGDMKAACVWEKARHGAGPVWVGGDLPNLSKSKPF